MMASTLKALGALLVICFFIFKPAGNTQRVVSPTIEAKEKENRDIKARIEVKQDSVMSALRKVTKEGITPKVVYKTKWRTVYLDNNTCDTMFYLVKKNGMMKRMLTGRKMDTTILQ